MNLSQKQITRHLTLGFSVLCLLVFLAACSLPGSSTGSSTPTPTATPTPTPSPTPAATLQTYTGTGYTIGYPQGWKEQNTNGAITFTDSLGVNTLSIAVAPDPGATASADTLASTTITALGQSLLKSAQPVANLPTTTTLNGVTWAQRGETGTATSNGQSAQAKVILLVTIHPASSPSSQAYEIAYGGPTLTFDLENLTYQAMLQSFKFTS